jgi:uncharacterized membrane protein YuzA (DUF378 family)
MEGISGMKLYWSKKIYMFAVLLLVIGGLNWGYCGVFGKDLVSQTVGKINPMISRVIFVLVGLAALYVGFSRDTYLPFLGETLVPCSVLVEKTPDGANVSKEVLVTPGAKVLFWASEPQTEHFEKLNDWRKAYLEYANAGVTTADATGRATLRVRKPQPYSVPMKGRLESHIHYRVCGSNGFIGPVKTIFIGSIVSEGFDDSELVELFEDQQKEENKKENKEEQEDQTNMPMTQNNQESDMFQGYQKDEQRGSNLDAAFASPLL